MRPLHYRRQRLRKAGVNCYHWSLGERVYQALKDKGLNLHLIEDILTDWPGPPGYYRFPYDFHPTPHATEEMANYVVKKILK